MVGVNNTIDLFNPIKRPKKLRGVILFFLGIVLILLRWTFVGISLELIGMLSLFGDFLPIVVSFMRALPYVGPVLSMPVVGTIVDKLAGSAEKRAPV